MSVRAVILAYDGGLVSTLDARALAVHEALCAEGLEYDEAVVRRCLPGRSLAETVSAVVREHADTRGRVPDALSIELAALRADRAYAAMAARGLPVVADVVTWLDRVAPDARRMLRADSRRRDVSHTLTLSQLEPQFSFVRCSDDGGARTIAVTDDTMRTLVASYAHLADRLALRGIPANACDVYEPHQLARGVAAAAGFHVLESFPFG